MFITILSAYLILSYIFVLEAGADHIILLWPVFILLFFWDTKKLALIASMIGFFLDLYSPAFGIYLFLFPATVLVGKSLISSLFSHRTIASFLSVSAILVIAFTFGEYAIFWFLYSVLPSSSYTLPSAQLFFLLRASWIIFQFFVLFFCYIIARRFEKRFGYAVDTVL